MGCGNVDSPAQTSAAAADGGVAGTGTPAVSAADGTWQWGDPEWEAAVRAKVEGKTFKIGFTPPAASEFYDIITVSYTHLDVYKRQVLKTRSLTK